MITSAQNQVQAFKLCFKKHIATFLFMFYTRNSWQELKVIVCNKMVRGWGRKWEKENQQIPFDLQSQSGPELWNWDLQSSRFLIKILLLNLMNNCIHFFSLFHCLQSKVFLQRVPRAHFSGGKFSFMILRNRNL